ncbi:MULTISPECIES: GNAT family N-acetyltransferase [Solibacillus]|uniref:GNAT family N-acetyltransferase n=1 Tax=Solibacillus merdavium TaxID=2762218 RepID=A0ABR8XSL4_9BACL|nr:GNAT family N-acetyltransferase [Solibacillus merdavium]MBD8034928.1 GNAT family N-acetyltransferase [Solibacillus merdavium]
MNIVPYEIKYAAKIAALLNDYLPFEIENAHTIDQAGGIRYLSLNEHEEVVGYIAGYEIIDFNKDFPYFQNELQFLKERVSSGTAFYTSHFVVHPNERKKGIGTELLRAYLSAAETIAQTIITVGWVQSDTNRWAAERQFVEQGFEPVIYMPRYFEPYKVDCPSCKGLCYCDAHIFIK